MQPEREDYGARLEGVVAESFGSSYPCAAGFFFTNPELSMQLWSGIIGTSGFDAEALFVQRSVTTTHYRVARY